MFLSSLNKKVIKSMESKPQDIKERTFNFALSCLRLSKVIANEQKEFIITRQMSRSATSVGANVREARNSVSKRDFINKIAIAQKECDETLYWLELLDAFVELDYPQITQNKKEADEILRILSTIIIRTKNNS